MLHYFPSPAWDGEIFGQRIFHYLLSIPPNLIPKYLRQPGRSDELSDTKSVLRIL